MQDTDFSSKKQQIAGEAAPDWKTKNLKKYTLQSEIPLAKQPQERSSQPWAGTERRASAYQTRETHNCVIWAKLVSWNLCIFPVGSLACWYSAAGW